MDYYGGLGSWLTFTFSEVDFKVIIDVLNSIVVVVMVLYKVVYVAYAIGGVKWQKIREDGCRS